MTIKKVKKKYKKNLKTRSILPGETSTTQMMRGTEKIKRTCNQSDCGKEFTAPNKFIRTCQQCKRDNYLYNERSDISFYRMVS